MARCNKMAYSGLWSLFTALYLIPTTRGYGWDMDVLFMIMYGVTLMQIQNKGKLSFCAFKWPIIFFLPLRLMQNRSNDAKKRREEKKTVFLTFGGLVYSVFLSVFVSEPSSSGLPWQNFWLEIAVLFSHLGEARNPSWPYEEKLNWVQIHIISAWDKETNPANNIWK